MTRVTIENFPSFSWLVVSSAMHLLVSAGVLNYRNEMPFNDSGVTVNPWSKGPQYIGLAGMWANMVEKKKTDFKIAINYAKTFGIVKSPEYMLWDYAGLYTGPGYGTMASSGGNFTALGSQNTVPTPQIIQTPSKTEPFYFKINTWATNPLLNRYEINFSHNLAADVDVRITDPNSGLDLRNKCSIEFKGKNLLTISVPLAPDGRFEGQMIAFKL
jgi:hypothetical protein